MTAKQTFKTILVPGVAWPSPPSNKNRRLVNSITTSIQRFIAANPGVTIHEVRKAFPKTRPASLRNALEKLWKAKRLSSTVIMYAGRKCRRYYLGEKA